MSGPMAEPFTALGRGNGFPFCLPALDVSGVPEERLVVWTQAEAMKAYWNLYSMTGSAEYAPGGIIRDNVSLELTREPVGRICNVNNGAESKETEFGGSILVSLDAPNATRLRRYFDGETMIGYGLASGAAFGSALAIREENEDGDLITPIFARVSIGTHLPPGTQPGDRKLEEDWAKLNFDGLPVLVKASVQYTESPFIRTGVLDASIMEAEIEIDVGAFVRDYYAKTSEMTFYQYE